MIMKKNKRLKNGLILFFIPVVILILASCNNRTEENWRSLFNGENLDGWTIKISGFEPGENYNNTFRVEDGLMIISYDEYESFDNRFGHIFYEEPFSHYILRVEYRFTGEQVKDGPGWAYRNNGIMFHSQAPETMDIDQDFPDCIEAQLLGGDGTNERSNFNLCTPGTHVVIDGQLRTEHCISSGGPTFHGDQWVTVELHVYGDSIIHHIIANDTIMTYSKPQISATGELLRKGYIALQAESHPTEFRKIEILDLSNDY
jgi:hypothetical protein